MTQQSKLQGRRRGWPETSPAMTRQGHHGPLNSRAHSYHAENFASTVWRNFFRRSGFVWFMS